MDKKATRAARMTKIQKECLVAFLEANKFLMDTKMKPSELETFNLKWKELADHLNNQPGAKKTVSQWKDALNEFKVSTRRKARLIHLEHTGTGGGPTREMDLTDLEERLLALLSKVVIMGIPVAEVGIEENLGSPDENVILEEIDIITDEHLTIKPGISNNTLRCSSAPDIQLITPKKPSNPLKIKKATQNLGDIAKDHEQCLMLLTESNNNLARATNAHSRLLARKSKARSGVFNLFHK